VVAQAAADGLMARASRARGGDGDDKPEGVAGDEPLAEWEQELLTSGAGSDGASLTATGATEAPAPAAAPAPATTSNGTQTAG
jgi:small subunit ribosomal protein S2